MQSLPIFLDLTGRKVVLIGEGEAADAKRRLVERAGGIIVGEEDAEARIGFVALEGALPAQAAAHRLRRAGCSSMSPTGRLCATSPCPRLSIASRC